jgi:hypothetical protein
MEKIALINTSQGGGATTYVIDARRDVAIFGGNPTLNTIVRLLSASFSISGGELGVSKSTTPESFTGTRMYLYVSQADAGSILRITFSFTGNIYDITLTSGAGYYTAVISEVFPTNINITFEATNLTSTTDIILTSWSFIVSDFGE